LHHCPSLDLMGDLCKPSVRSSRDVCVTDVIGGFTIMCCVTPPISGHAPSLLRFAVKVSGDHRLASARSLFDPFYSYPSSGTSRLDTGSCRLWRLAPTPGVRRNGDHCVFTRRSRDQEKPSRGEAKDRFIAPQHSDERY